VPSALAAEVTVRVEGNSATLLPRTTVTVPTTAVKPDGVNECAGGSAGVALWAATGGNIQASYFNGLGYFISKVMGEGYDWPDPRSWEYWRNGASSGTGLCDDPVQQGDEILMLITRCDGYDANYNCTSPEILPLKLTIPTVVTLGQPVAATVQASAKSGTLSPVSGAAVSGADASVTTGSDGKAELTFSARGVKTVTTTAQHRIRDSREVCVTDGADGYCGTTPAPGVAPPPPSASGSSLVASGPCKTNGRDGLCGTTDTTQPWSHLGTPAHGKRFARGKAPRTLSGTIESDGSGIAKVELRLTRRNGKVCGTFDGGAERFVKLKRCGAERGKWFTIGDRESWSYLLPGALSAGRYVLDVRVTDKAGNKTTLARGYTRSVFHVG